MSQQTLPSYLCTEGHLTLLPCVCLTSLLPDLALTLLSSVPSRVCLHFDIRASFLSWLCPFFNCPG